MTADLRRLANARTAVTAGCEFRPLIHPLLRPEVMFSVRLRALPLAGAVMPVLPGTPPAATGHGRMGRCGPYRASLSWVPGAAAPRKAGART